jgi:hypothetical protein
MEVRRQVIKGVGAYRGDGSLPPLMERGGLTAAFPPVAAGGRSGSVSRARTVSRESGDSSLPPIARGGANDRSSSRNARPPSDQRPNVSVRATSRNSRPPRHEDGASSFNNLTPRGVPSHRSLNDNGRGNDRREAPSRNNRSGAPVARRPPQGTGSRMQVPPGAATNGYGSSGGRAAKTNLPSAAEVRRAAEQAAERAIALAEAEVGPLRPCPHCNRSFKEEAYAKHVLVCQKVFQQKRKVYNATEHRLPDEPELVKIKKMAAAQTRKGEIGIGAKKDVAPPLKSAWRIKSKQFRQGMRDARLVDKYKREGRPMSELPPARATDPQLDDRIPCPHCGRRFGSVQAERHIPICQQKSKAMASRGAVSKLGSSKAQPTAPRMANAATRPRRLA